MLQSKRGEVKRKVPSFQRLDEEYAGGAICSEPETARVSRGLDHLICLGSRRRSVSSSDRFLCLTAASPFDRQIDLTSSGHGGMNSRTPGEAPAIQKGRAAVSYENLLHPYQQGCGPSVPGPSETTRGR